MCRGEEKGGGGGGGEEGGCNLKSGEWRVGATAPKSPRSCFLAVN